MVATSRCCAAILASISATIFIQHFCELGETHGALFGDLSEPLSMLFRHLFSTIRALVSTPTIAISSRGCISRRIASRVVSRDGINIVANTSRISGPKK
jgi:uncharacterized protein YggT (Ycf19 family)